MVCHYSNYILHVINPCESLHPCDAVDQLFVMLLEQVYDGSPRVVGFEFCLQEFQKLVRGFSNIRELTRVRLQTHQYTVTVPDTRARRNLMRVVAACCGTKRPCWQSLCAYQMLSLDFWSNVGPSKVDVCKESFPGVSSPGRGLFARRRICKGHARLPVCGVMVESW